MYRSNRSGPISWPNALGVYRSFNSRVFLSGRTQNFVLNDGGPVSHLPFPRGRNDKKAGLPCGAGPFLLPGCIHSPTAGPARFGSRKTAETIADRADAVILDGLCLRKKVARRVEGADAATDRKRKP